MDPFKLTPLIFIAVLSLLSLEAKGQRDTKFWFAAPDIDIVNDPTYGQFDRPILLRISTFNLPATVTVSLPANASVTPLTVSILANGSATVDLTSWINNVENNVPNQILNKGLLIEATAEISVYYEMKSESCNCNPELFALKGKNALGSQFIIPSQKTWAIDSLRFPNARAAFNIVADQDNTNVTITPSSPLIGRNAGESFSITLNRGQSFSCQGRFRNGNSLLDGSIVVADKPVAVTSTEDLLFSDGICADLAGDQIVPVCSWGNEFVVIRGELNVRDKVVVTAATNGTSVFRDGNPVAVALINRGHSYEFDLPIGTNVAYITSDKNVSVLHYTGVDCEVSSAVIPKLTNNGSTDIGIIKTVNEDAYVFVVTGKGNETGFTVNGNATVLSASDFSTVPGSSNRYVYCKKKIDNFMVIGEATRIKNALGLFQLGFINGAAPGFTTGCRYGYFSDFKSSTTFTPISEYKICKGDTVKLKAIGGVSYSWSPSVGLNNTNSAEPDAHPLVTTKYKVIIVSPEGCTDSAFVTVKVSPGPGPLSMGTVKQSCNQFSFTGTSGAEGSIGFWLWIFGDGTIALSQNTTHTFAANGTYEVKLTATDTTGCKDSSASTQVLVNFPEVLATGSTTICKGDTAQLSVSGADTFQWQPTQGLSSTTGTVISAFPRSTTAYIVTGTSSGCNAADTITVSVSNGPPISISNDTTICSGKKLQLFANGAVNYTWSPASLLSSSTAPNPEASPQSTTMFYLTATSPALLCSSQDSVLVTVAPAPQFNIATPQPVCKDGKAQLNASGGTSYAWQPAAMLTAPGTPNPQTLALNQNTNFTVKIVDAFCKDSTVLSTTVTLLPTPTITASKSNDIDCATPRAILSAAGADNYTWSSSSGLPLYLDNTIGSTVTANPPITKQYTVTGKDNTTSCAGSDTITIIVNKQGTTGSIYVPSAFSPNGDGLNDCFRVSSTGTPLTKFRLSIYNRYGEMIYNTAKAGDCWDGKYKGKLQENGNYVYILWIDDDCSNEKFKKGNVVLMH